MLLMMTFTATAYGLIEQVLPYLLKFLADEYDDTSTAVFAFVNDILAIVCIHSLISISANLLSMYSSRSRSVLCSHTPNHSRNSWDPC